MNGKRVDAAAQFARECLIDQPVALNPGLPFERLCHDIDAEVSLASRPVTCVANMLGALILHTQLLGCEGFVQLVSNCIRGSHS